MARPRFIICAERRIVDRETNLCTFVNVADGLTFTLSHGPGQPVQPGSHSQSMFVCAAWMRTEEDNPDDDFDFEVRLHWDDKATVIANGSFRFTQETQRIDVQVMFSRTGTFAPGKGIMLLESRIRKAGNEDWLSQEYPIIASVRAEEPTAPPADAQLPEGGSTRDDSPL